LSLIRIKTKKPWIAYPGSTVQQNYAEDLRHGYLLWDVQGPRSFDVSFCELPNPRPFVTVDWQGSVEDTLAEAIRHPKGSRFRIRSKEYVSQKDMTQLTGALRGGLGATEVTYKNEEEINRDFISTGEIQVVKDDLRNPDVLVRLVKEYCKDKKLSDEEHATLAEQVQGYLKACGGDEDVARNVKWTLRDLKFDNLFGYGEDNHVNFDSLSGITGIFGPNRAGKSSIVGAFFYSLFNDTDRGSIKNVHVVNTRKQYGYSRAIINVNGTDYVIERSGARDKKGNVKVEVNFYKLDGDKQVPLNAEARRSTNEIIRRTGVEASPSKAKSGKVEGSKVAPVGQTQVALDGKRHSRPLVFLP
jgi:hypothetical protein